MDRQSKRSSRIQKGEAKPRDCTDIKSSECFQGVGFNINSASCYSEVMEKTGEVLTGF